MEGLGRPTEIEAFLGGRFVDHLAKHGQPVPAWAVVNRLAHADHAELVRLVDGDLLDARYGAAKPTPGRCPSGSSPRPTSSRPGA